MNDPAKTLALYKSAEQYVAIIEELVQAGGELTPELEARLDAVQDQFSAKAEAVALCIRNLEASARAALAEAKRLQAIAQQRQRAAEYLTDYFLRHLRWPHVGGSGTHETSQPTRRRRSHEQLERSGTQRRGHS